VVVPGCISHSGVSQYFIRARGYRPKAYIRLLWGD